MKLLLSVVCLLISASARAQDGFLVVQGMDAFPVEVPAFFVPVPKLYEAKPLKETKREQACPRVATMRRAFERSTLHLRARYWAGRTGAREAARSRYSNGAQRARFLELVETLRSDGERSALSDSERRLLHEMDWEIENISRQCADEHEAAF